MFLLAQAADKILVAVSLMVNAASFWVSAASTAVKAAA